MNSRLDLSPLSASERIADASREDWGAIVTPVPAASPLPPSSHYTLGQPTARWTYRDASGEVLFYVFRFDRPNGGKDFLPLSLWHGAIGPRWRRKGVPAPRPLFGLEQLASRPGAPVMVCEGEKSCEAARLVLPEFVVVTSPNGAGSASKADWAPLAAREVVIWPDNDEDGAAYARTVAAFLKNLGCKVGIIDVSKLIEVDGGRRSPDRKIAGWDAADAVDEWVDLGKLRDKTLGLASPETGETELQVSGTTTTDTLSVELRIAELSALNGVDYARTRTTAAKELGFRVGDLDRLVRERRPSHDDLQGRAITFPVVEPWPAPVDGAVMLHELAAALRVYVVISGTQADALALWVVFTHVHDAFDVSPRLVVKSPHKRSGKTTLFTGLYRLVAKPRGASGITSSALLRLIELHHPTMLIDEMDALMAADREMSQALRGLMNSGFNRRFANFTMNVPTREGGYEPREFSTWAPLALAGIGDLPDTIRDRSIEIEMKRKFTTETVKRLRRRDGKDLDEIARKLVRWAYDNLDRLGTVEPSMPDGLNDRAADAWEPLVAIAEVAGGGWPSRARAAALALSGQQLSAAGDADIDTMLLSDIRGTFWASGGFTLSGDRLTERLVEIDGRPWAEWKNGRPLTKHQLARRLKEKYQIRTDARDFDGEGRLKGYRIEDFADVFARYLPAVSDSTRELVKPVQKIEENTDSRLVIGTTDHEFEMRKNNSNINELHDITSLRPVHYSASVAGSAPATGADKHGGEIIDERRAEHGWTGRMVL
jgi:hypothetical protein